LAGKISKKVNVIPMLSLLSGTITRYNLNRINQIHYPNAIYERGKIKWPIFLTPIIHNPPSFRLTRLPKSCVAQIKWFSSSAFSTRTYPTTRLEIAIGYQKKAFGITFFGTVAGGTKKEY